MKSPVQGNKTADVDFQMTVLQASFKWCTHCTTDSTNVSWQLKLAARQLTWFLSLPMMASCTVW